MYCRKQVSTESNAFTVDTVSYKTQSSFTCRSSPVRCVGPGPSADVGLQQMCPSQSPTPDSEALLPVAGGQGHSAGSGPPTRPILSVNKERNEREAVAVTSSKS